MAVTPKESGYADAMRRVNDIINSVSMEIYNHFPTTGLAAVDDRTHQEISNDLFATSQKIRAEYARNHPPYVPAREEVLQRFSEGAESGLVRAAAESILRPQAPPLRRSPEAAARYEEREMPGHLRSREMPAQARQGQPLQPSVPRRVSSAPPSISQLRGQGFTNILDMRIDEETVLRFASNEPNLDVIGMTYSQLLEYAKNNPGSIRVFSVDERGRATREIRPSSL
ncbi:MAG TPA: hypothetical protein PKJ97_00480 [Candidatus Bilamarchaeaceae archaeon]|nr:hypothetical protein [Candidatus Bilamarchaeaceae archaeon]